MRRKRIRPEETADRSQFQNLVSRCHFIIKETPSHSDHSSPHGNLSLFIARTANPQIRVKQQDAQDFSQSSLHDLVNAVTEGEQRLAAREKDRAGKYRKMYSPRETHALCVTDWQETYGTDSEVTETQTETHTYTDTHTRPHARARAHASMNACMDAPERQTDRQTDTHYSCYISFYARREQRTNTEIHREGRN